MRARCAVEVGARELKLVEARSGRLTGHAEVVLPVAAFADGVPTEALGQSLADALKQAGVHATRTRLALPDAEISVRDFRLPLIPRRELSSVVSYEGKRLVPMHPADVYYAWHLHRDGKGYAVYLVAARRAVIDGFVRVFAQQRMQVERIDLKPLALARGAQVSDGLILEWGLGEATLVFMANSRPQFFRTILLDAPEDRFDAQFEELVLALNASVRFIRSSDPGLVIGPTTPLYLAGRFALLPGAEERAYEQFGFSVRWPAPRTVWKPGFPWQSHLTGLGLITQTAWKKRITPGEAGDIRVAA